MRLPRTNRLRSKNRATKFEPIIPPFTENYYKARRSLTLFSALLIAWNFIDVVEIRKKFTVPLKPEVMPYILVFLILYFGYRFLVEYNHSPNQRRRMPTSRIDLRTNLAIPLIALLSFTLPDSTLVKWFPMAQRAFEFDNNKEMLETSLVWLGALGIGYAIGAFFGTFVDPTMQRHGEESPPDPNTKQIRRRWRWKIYLLILFTGLILLNSPWPWTHSVWSLVPIGSAVAVGVAFFRKKFRTMSAFLKAMFTFLEASWGWLKRPRNLRTPKT